MTKAIVSVPPETSVRDVAKVLLQSGIGAVPVVDAAGALVGMASEDEATSRYSCSGRIEPEQARASHE